MTRRPIFLATLTWLYVIWSLAPVLLAIQFSFNSGRSRSTWQGFSTRWYCCDPSSVVEDPSLHRALLNSLILALLTTLVATPLGVALALGLARWRGRTSRAANGLMLVPLATPELVLGSFFSRASRMPGEQKIEVTASCPRCSHELRAMATFRDGCLRAFESLEGPIQPPPTTSGIRAPDRA